MDASGSEQKTPKQHKDCPYKIEQIVPEDAPQVIEILKESFADEPINTYLGLKECKELEEYSIECVSDGCSFKAVHNNGEIMGVSLNALMKRPPPGAVHEKLVDSVQNPKLKIIMAFMDYVHENFNIFDLYPEIDVILDTKILTVGSKYRALGVAGRLARRSIEYMRENNIQLLYGSCSSDFSARAMENLGGHEVYKIKYSDYRPNGEIVLAPPPPHDSTRILVVEVGKVKRQGAV